MRITADTNVLVRAITGDDEDQARAAQAELARAELVALTLPTLCELAWVLGKGYRHSHAEIASVIRRLIGSRNVRIDRPAAECGWANLEAGGDFADGVIAYEGRWLGANMFVSFDSQAVRLMEAQGGAARTPRN